MVFTFAFLGLLTGCAQAVVSEPAPALPSTAAERQATSAPAPESETTVPVPPGRCDERGFLTTSQSLEVEVIETLKDFTPNSERVVNHMCHNPLTDTLLITNKNEILEFNPKTRQLTPFIDATATGYSHEQGNTFEFKNLKKCIVDTDNNLYVEDKDTSQIYFIEPQTKRISTLTHLNPEETEQTTNFGHFPDFTRTQSGTVFITDHYRLYRANGIALDTVFKIFGSGAVMPVYQGYFPAKVDPITKWPIDVDLTGIGTIATDDKNNIYMTSSPQKGFFRLTPSGSLSMIDPNGLNRLEDARRNTYHLISTVNLQYHSTYKVFLGISDSLISPFIVTRDGCLGQVTPSHARDVAITNDGSIYGVSFKQLEILKFTVPPDLPEKAQWEPPQAWKDATGLD